MMLRQKTDDLELENHANDMISFEEISQNYCVGVVDIENSTQNIARLSQEQASTFYSVFLNTIGYIIQNNGGKVVKNTGDGILFYFPKISTISGNCDLPLDCSTKILHATDTINKIYKKRNISEIHYRISLDYGPLMIAKYVTSSCRDIFGPTVNLCSKINHLAKPDQLVMGGDLYQIVKKSKEYKFVDVAEFQSTLKENYPIYSVETLLK